MTTTMNQMGGHPAMGAGPMMEGRGPSMRRVAFAVRERPTPEGTRSFWTRIGAVFENRDGSLTVKLDALPVDGVLQIRDDDRETRRPPAVNAPF